MILLLYYFFRRIWLQEGILCISYVIFLVKYGLFYIQMILLLVCGIWLFYKVLVDLFGDIQFWRRVKLYFNRKEVIIRIMVDLRFKVSFFREFIILNGIVLEIKLKFQIYWIIIKDIEKDDLQLLEFFLMFEKIGQIFRGFFFKLDMV